MSSRIYPAGKPVEAQPIAWRRQSSGADPHPAAAQRQQPAGTGAAESSSADAQREIEARIAAAYQQGLQAGEAAAAQGAKARLGPVLAGLSTILADLTGMRKRVRGEAEEATVALALAIARRVLHREIASDPEAILGLVKAAFQKCDARETHRLRLSPDGAQIIRQQLARLNLPPALEVIADGSLPQGSAIFETSRGDLDASVDTQLAEIEYGLTDMVRRNSR
jgi:flagellar assembly protein FliH